jgi:hypothetical protein
VTCLPYLHPYIRRNKKSIKFPSYSHNTSFNKTTANPWRDEHQFEEINVGIAGKTIGVDRIRNSSEAGETTLSPDLARVESWNDDNRSDVELAEPNRTWSVQNKDIG